MRIRTICIEAQKEFQMLDDELSYPSSFDVSASHARDFSRELDALFLSFLKT